MTQTLTESQHSLDHDPYALVKLTPAAKFVSFIGVTVPFIGVISAMYLLWNVGFGWLYAGLLLGFYVLTAVGITVGYHRYFCHKSFEASRPLEIFLAILGTMAWEGPILKWCAMHRCHHQHSDGVGDPHSPHHHHHDEEHGDDVKGVIKGFFHAHVGWIFKGDPQNLMRYVKDLEQDKTIKLLSDYWWLTSMIGTVLPGIIAGLVTQSWMGALLGFIWGGLVRIFLVHHVTWSINSVCHVWGTRPYRSHDQSRNNPIFGLVGLGEGWHNNHHAFPTSARHGLKWWQIDISYYIIRTFGLLGLASDIRVPSAARLAAKQIDAPTDVVVDRTPAAPLMPPTASS
jgi:stearoyl-CoA desaturase (delta-9 desaturase)